MNKRIYMSMVAVILLFAMAATASAVSVTRGLPDDPVAAGAVFDVSISQTGFFVAGTVTEVLPEGYVYVDGSATPVDDATYVSATRTLELKIDAATSAVTYSVTAGTTTDTLTGTYATIDASANPVLGDVTGDSEVTIEDGAVVSVTRGLPDGLVDAGAVFDVSVSQTGFFVAGTVTEVLPEGYVYVDGSATPVDDATYVSATRTLELKIDAATSAVTYSVTAGTTTDTLTGTYATIDASANPVLGDVTGDSEVTIALNGDCDNTVEAGVPFIVTSGLVSLTGNFTNDGYACIQEIEDPMPESEDDVRGAEVVVSENATLNLTGDGDTWKLTYGESSTYETSPVFQEYEMHQDMPDPDRTTQTAMEAEYNDSLNQSIGLCVESDCGYFAEDWFGEAYVAIDGNADEICRLLVEFEDDDNKTLAIGEEWDINSGYSLTASQIDSEGKKVWILFKRDGVLLDDEVIDINKTEQDRVYTYTADIGSEFDIPVFSFYLDKIGDDFVQLTYVFLIDEDVLVIETSDEYNGMEVMTASSSRVVLECDGVEEWAFYADGDISEVGNGTYALVYSEPEPKPTPSYSRRGGGGGGSSGGTYPPDMSGADSSPSSDDPAVSGGDNDGTYPPESEPEGEDADVSEPGTTGAGENVTEPEPTPTPESPGFAGVFVILGILAVAYLRYRKKQ